MQNFLLNGVRTFATKTSSDLIIYAFDKKAILVAVNAEKILYANNITKSIINNNIGYPDGIGAVWALKKKGALNPIKIPGCELWLEIINEFKNQKSFYLIGSSDEVIKETVKKLKTDFSNINIVNYRNGFINSIEEKEELIKDIIERKPDVIFVAMGSPKQELLMEEIHSFHPAVYQGLGGSFDLYVGLTKRAPDWWMKYFKWEGLYRSISDLTNFSRWKRQKAAFVFMIKLWTNKL
jgi:UDP-N-acetyl-D-mannosaminouronate:lipid I N-acetyl-D-mannosaminouronosyltransferase